MISALEGNYHEFAYLSRLILVHHHHDHQSTTPGELGWLIIGGGGNGFGGWYIQLTIGGNWMDILESSRR